MILTSKLKERFCKDTNIPIKIYQEPYFTSRLELYDSQFNTLEKYQIFKDNIENYRNEQDYFAEYNKLKDIMIEHIKSTTGYNRFIQEDFQKYATDNRGISQKDIFKHTNIGKRFISLDMVKANFSALSHYDKTMFGDAETYEEFIIKFTDNQHFIQSKYIRQVVFGNANPKRQTTYEKYLMGKVMDQLLEQIDKDEILSFSCDEIVIDITNLNDSDIKYIHEIPQIFEGQEIPLTIEEFDLYKVGGTGGYMKSINTGEIELKCLDSLNYPFVLRKLNGEEIAEEDKVFYYEGKLAQLIDVPEIEIIRGK